MTKAKMTEIKGLPWIGVAHKFLNSSIDMMDEFAKTDGELLKFKFFGGTAYTVTSPNLVREVLVSKAKQFRKVDAEVKLMGRFMGNGLVTNNDPDHHKRQRKLAQPAFHMRRIAEYAEVMVDYTEMMLDEWQAGSVRDISHEMRDLTMYIVSKTLFDVGRDDISGDAGKLGHAMEAFQNSTDDNFGLPITLPEWVPTKNNREFKAAMEYMNTTLMGIINTRRATGEDKGDLLSMLLLSQDEDGGGMPVQQLLDEVITLFAAGHETTSNALTWTFYQLSQQPPEVLERIQAELDDVLAGRAPTLGDLADLPYTLMVLKESMRLLPSVYALNGRMANQDVEIGGHMIPEDSYVLVSPWALHHNPDLWEDPERFDPERFSAENEPNIPRYAYLPFGAGTRVCIGQSFAMMEAHLILATVLQRFELALIPEQKIELLPQITLSSKHGMHMKVLPRKHVARDEGLVSAEIVPA